jgi:electron-transferring-flavoprotein dehydrogenase
MKRIEYDVLFVGGGISSLSAAHRLVDLARQNNLSLRIAILEKGKDFGSHVLSGAVSNRRSIKKLFPNYEMTDFPIEGKCTTSHMTILGQKKTWDMPSFLSPPEMDKLGYLILSLSNVVKWMASNLTEKVKDTPSIVVDLYNGFPASSIIYNGNSVAGVRVDSTGINEGDNCYAKVTLFGDKGFISRDIITRFNLEQTSQKWAVGVKEVWETEEDLSGKVWHTIGYPLLDGSFGGGFIYGLKDKKIAIGMIVSLDSENPALHPPQILQAFKKHPWVQEIIKGGKLLKYGASIIPEGGYYSLPKEFAVDGAIIIGDALGVLDLKGFSGVDKAMESGMIAGEIIFEALQKSDFSTVTLGQFKQKLMDGWVGKELKSSRYYRYAFHKNKRLFSKYLPNFLKGLDNYSPFIGFINTFLSNPIDTISSAINLKRMMSGKTDIGPVKWQEDRTYSRADYRHNPLSPPLQKGIQGGCPEVKGFSKNTIYSTADLVFYAFTHYHHGNRHIDEFNADVCRQCIQKYHTYDNEVPCVGDCTAEVHEVRFNNNEKFHFMNLENCVQCRTCEIVCPEKNLKVNPAEHGSGPDFFGL